MSLIGRVDVGLPPGDDALAAAPEMLLQVEDSRTAAGESWRFVFWASGGDFERYEAGLAADPTVASFRYLSELSGPRTVRPTSDSRCE